MPEFIPLSLILQAHTIPAIKKPQRKPGHFTYSCLYGWKTMLSRFIAKWEKGLFSGENRGRKSMAKKT